MRHSTQMDAMWMGPRGYEQWVPAPLQGPNFGRVGYTASRTYINGGTGRKLSKAAHKEYPMSWPHSTRDELRPIADMRAGVYGDGLIYFIDPFASDYNVLPMQWSFPAQACYDAPPLYGSVRPSKVQTSANTLGYPAESALYKYEAGGTTRPLYIPIPPGYTAWVGVHGSKTGTNAGLYVEEIGGGSGYATLLDVTDPNRVVDSHTGISGIVLSVRVEDGNLSLAGLMVQIIVNGLLPEPGNFISGQGHSGCIFDDSVEEDIFSSWYDDMTAGATLVEVGDWQ